MILGALRGMRVLVPRNMTQAAGFYNTLLRSDEPALVIECLNGYRLKEQIPTNVGEFTLPLGVPEVLREGADLTVVTYGSMCRIVLDAAQQLADVGISVEVIDVQTLLPFDLQHLITDSIRKTSRVLFADEDVPGGATAYLLQQVVDEQPGLPLPRLAPGAASRPRPTARPTAPTATTSPSPAPRTCSTPCTSCCRKPTRSASRLFIELLVVS